MRTWSSGAVGLLLAALVGCAAQAPPPASPSAAPAGAAEWADEGAEYRARATARGGSPASIEVTVETIGGFHLNDDYPHHFTFTPPSPGAGSRIEAAAMTFGACAAAPAERCRLAFEAPLPPPQPGPATVAGELAFAACDADRCVIEKLPLRLALPSLPVGH